MKKITIILSFLTLVLTLASCKKFLKETSQDELIPQNADDLASLLYSDGYPYLQAMDTYTDLLTDDIQSNGVPQLNGAPNTTYVPYQTYGTPVYTWDPTMFDNITGAAGSNLVDQNGVNSWTIYYNKIKGCNVVMDYIGSVTGTDKVKNGILGQALFLRAFYYLKLVTLYGKPYNGPGVDPTTSLGVPLILTSKVSDVYPKRNTLAEVYAQIETDLLTAASLLRDNYTPSSLFRVSHIAAYTLLSRLYLYMGRDADMDNVIKYSEMALALKRTLTPLTNYFTSGSTLSSAGIYDQTLSTEVIWSYGFNVNRGSNPTTFFPGYNTFTGIAPPFSVSNSLAALYDKGNGSNTNYGDLRYKLYFETYSNGGSYPFKSGKIGFTQTYGDKGIRVAELYLNHAEANARKYLSTGQASYQAAAMADLNYLRQNRYDTRNTPYTSVNIADATQLLKFLQDERRRELCLEENFRWVDIKRWNLSVTHTLIDPSGTSSTYTLASGSNSYALQIPYDVMARNYNLQQNPR
ncbi:RagB/SusD family nutrient uptake outer membrane protein [Mucilaginibacter sp. RS28]|uniref:RagB/SusD family nutrient uptake outer membrane protein n=1 Tax=Mucilaginibacter straminoryzae TaxID=2932774 RepID=A0A9X2B8M1_9SPHI|nr:RagB/SusD family nutrient uptake outer membrane protein [Mucilaginibacter straminoryzae]MCJ8209759.1 RagB/SusD family nutrient uptake outer membrane protein [Mucilaginibacter straminoryzae]